MAFVTITELKSRLARLGILNEVERELAFSRRVYPHMELDAYGCLKEIPEGLYGPICPNCTWWTGNKNSPSRDNCFRRFHEARKRNMGPVAFKIFRELIRGSRIPYRHGTRVPLESEA